MADLSGLLHSVTLLARLTSDTIVHGSTTCLRAPPEAADGECQGGAGGRSGKPGEHRALKSPYCLASPALTEACKQYGKETLIYLAFLEGEGTLENVNSTAMKSCLSKITAIGEVLSVSSLDKVIVDLGCECL